MIVNVNTRKRDDGATRLNKEQWVSGEAVLLYVQNFPIQELALNQAAYRNLVLEGYARRNTRLSKPYVHFMLAFSPDEALIDERVGQICTEFMEKMGSGEQPYFVY